MLSTLLKVTLLALVLAAALLPDTKSLFGFDLRLLTAPDIKLPDTFSGPLLANRLLSQADHLFNNEIRGPESFATWQGKVYTSLADGRIVEVLEDRLRTVATIDPEKLGLEACRLPQNTVRCGRPLGLKFDSKGTLYTVDPYHGLYSIDVSTGTVKLIADVAKLGARFLDDLAVMEKTGNGDHKVFYLSDASTEWDLFDVAHTVAEHDSTGRLISYDTETDKVKVELHGLPFPNGLALTDDRTALLMCLFNHRAVHRYYLSGPKKGLMTPLAVDLPGEPDNIKRSQDQSRETYWVGLFSGRNRHNRHLIVDTLGVYSFLTRFGMRMGRAIGFAIEKTGVLLGSDCLTAFGFDFKTGHLLNVGMCSYGMVLEIDGNTGEVLHSLHSPDGTTCALSEAFEVKRTEGGERHFLLGSFANSYLGRLVLPKSAFQRLDSTVISSSQQPKKQSSSSSSSSSAAKSSTTKPASSPSSAADATDKSSSSGKSRAAAAKDEL